MVSGTWSPVRPETEPERVALEMVTFERLSILFVRETTRRGRLIGKRRRKLRGRFRPSVCFPVGRACRLRHQVWGCGDGGWGRQDGDPNNSLHGAFNPDALNGAPTPKRRRSDGRLI